MMRERRLVKGACALAHRGWAGEKSDFVSILLEEVADQLHCLFWQRDGMD
jgi:hypothetical protein